MRVTERIIRGSAELAVAGPLSYEMLDSFINDNSPNYYVAFGSAVLFAFVRTNNINAFTLDGYSAGVASQAQAQENTEISLFDQDKL